MQLEFESSKKSAAYNAAFTQLNEEQQKAVNTIEGPVMVIAGPGSGKTEILALRVGKILLETQASPHNILCLTYTEAGAIAMRKRLLKYIGPEAYQVPIYTFHALCNLIIQENPGQFTEHREMQPASELEQIDSIIEVIKKFPIKINIKYIFANTSG